MNIKAIKLSPKAKLPTKESLQAAGSDLYACLPEGTSCVMIKPHCTAKIPTGLELKIPEGYFGAVFAQSESKPEDGLRPANCTDVHNSDYHGEYIVNLHNDTDKAQMVSDGAKIAQLIILPCISANYEEVNQF